MSCIKQERRATPRGARRRKPSCGESYFFFELLDALATVFDDFDFDDLDGVIVTFVDLELFDDDLDALLEDLDLDLDEAVNLLFELPDDFFDATLLPPISRRPVTLPAPS
jgi:hypothetical protein